MTDCGKHCPDSPSQFPDYTYKVSMHLEHDGKFYELKRSYSGFATIAEIEHLWFKREPCDCFYSKELRRSYEQFPILPCGNTITIVEFTISKERS